MGIELKEMSKPQLFFDKAQFEWNAQTVPRVFSLIGPTRLQFNFQQV